MLASLLVAMPLQATEVEPATVEAAVKVLDLRAFPMMDGARIRTSKTLGMVMYDAKGTPAEAFEFQRTHLTKVGWKELPGGYRDVSNASGQFTKSGYGVTVSTHGATGDSTKEGLSNVTLVNHGNVDTSTLPVPPGVKPFFALGGAHSYLTEANVPETATACRELLIAAGWEPYGSASNDPQLPMMYFKRNAIRIMAWISTAPAQNNKTIIQYSADLLSADLPIPPRTPDPRYTDSDKTLRYDWPSEDRDEVIDFYQKKLPELGWTATTERPITDDSHGIATLVYRNPQKDTLTLDLRKFTGGTRVKLEHFTLAQVEELDRKAGELAERNRQEMAKKKIAIHVDVPLPAGAGEVEQDSERSFEFTVTTNGGPAAFQAFREHFSKSDWTEEDGTRTGRISGSMTFTKDGESIRLNYFDFDTAITDAEISVHGSDRLVLTPQASSEKMPRVAGAKPPGKESSLADLPGMPPLPPGVKLPQMSEDIEKDLTRLKEADDHGQPGKQKIATKSPTGTFQVSDIVMPPEATSYEYKKIVKMIRVESSTDAPTLAQFFIDDLGGKDWSEMQKSAVERSGGIVKLERGAASLTIFVHEHDDGSNATIVCKEIAWDKVPAAKVAAKVASQKPTRPARDAPAGSAAMAVDQPTRPDAAPLVVHTVTPAEQKQTGATMWVDKKEFKLSYGVAYQEQRDDETQTEVLLSIKPIPTDTLRALLKSGKDGGDAAGFGPQLKLRFDQDGTLDYLFLYADGLSVNRIGAGEDKIVATLNLADGRARGKAVLVGMGKLFDNEYRFDVTFDVKLATGQPGVAQPNSGNGVSSTTDPADDELAADDRDGIPYPVVSGDHSSTGSRYRKSATVSIPAELPAIVKFYRRELATRGWKETAQAAKITRETADLTFTGPEGVMTVKLAKGESDVTLNLASRSPAKAKAAGVLPQANRGRLILGNAADKECTVVVNGKPYMVAAGRGAKEPTDGISLHVLPGTYNCVIKVAGQPDQTEPVTVALDETWGVIVVPTGGFFAAQLY